MAERAAAGPGPAHLALTATALLWAGNFVAGRFMGGQIDPLTLNALRWSLALAILAPAVGHRVWAARAGLRRHWPRLAALSLTGIVAFHVCVYSALTMVPVANATLMIATTPFFILAGSALVLGRGLGRRDLAAVALGWLGVAVLLGEGNPARLLGGLRLGAGDLWMVGAVLAWASYTLLLRGMPAALPRDVVLAATMAMGVAVLLPLVALFGRTDLSTLPPPVWGGVAYVTLGASLAAYLCWSFGVARLGPAAAGFSLNLIPLFGVLLAWLLLGEVLSAGQAAGAAAILGALAIRR